jgi:RNA polymerase sigma-70 factor (ECF subfamily)
MQLFQEGDEEAFKELVRRYKEPIISFSARLLNSREKAMDIAQETFIRVFASADSYRPVGAFGGWLYRIAYNLAINELRSFDPRSPAPSAEDSLLGDERSALVRRCVAALPPKYRGAVVMKDMEGLTFDEIARILGCPESTVKSRVMRARRMLRKRLEGALAPRRSDVSSPTTVREVSGS